MTRPVTHLDAHRATRAKTNANEHGLRGQKRIAARWIARYQGKFMYTPGREWMQWTGSHWEGCTDAEPWQAVSDVCRDAIQDMAEMTDRSARDELYADVRTCDSERGTAGVLSHVRRAPGIHVPDDRLNNQPHLIAFPNGTFDLRDGTFREADPDDLITLVAGCDFDPAADCPLYDSLMDQYQQDEAIQDYLHRLAGAALEGRQNLQHLVTWYGASGGNGKGTVMRAWQTIFGDYAKVMPVEALLSRRGSAAEAYRDQKAQLKGVRLVFATEPSDGARFDSGTVKSLTGGDRVTARAMYKSTVEFDPTWLIVMPTNTRVATSSDGGMARRLKEIPWEFKIDPSQMRDDIDGILKAEAPGILNRILVGWFQYQDRGIQHPETVEAATEEYLAEVDPLRQFLDEHTILEGHARTYVSTLYERYKEFADLAGHTRWSMRVFSEKLSRHAENDKELSHVLTRKKTDGGRSTWIGLKLR